MQLKLLFKTLDDIRHENGKEYWFASELYPLLGYANMDNFLKPITRAKESCRMSGGDVDYHFVRLHNMVDIGSGAKREAQDIKLSRYACYLTALNGDPHKEEIAFAQAYFITKTREIEVLEQRMRELERIDSREKLKITEKEFSDMAFSRGVDGGGIAYVRSVGDKALFGKSTDEMKKKLGIGKGALADFLPNVTLKAKDLATAMTTENTRKKNLRGASYIGKEHTDSNLSVRNALVSSNIFPEELPVAEDIKKIEAKHRKQKAELEKQQKRELTEATKKLKQ